MDDDDGGGGGVAVKTFSQLTFKWFILGKISNDNLFNRFFDLMEQQQQHCVGDSFRGWSNPLLWSEVSRSV